VTAAVTAARRTANATSTDVVVPSAVVGRLVLAGPQVVPALIASVVQRRVAAPPVNVLNVSKRQDAALVRLVSNQIRLG
jgi:hypothetical protein